MGVDRRSRELLALGSEEDRAAFDGLALGCTESWGTARLRAAIADTHTTCGPEDVLAFAGAEEAIFWAMQLLAGPGEHVVVTVPNYQALETHREPAARRSPAICSTRPTLAAGPRRSSRRPASHDRPDRGRLPEQPHRRRARPRHLAGAGRPVRRTQDPPACRRGVPRPRAGPGADPDPGRGHVCVRCVDQRHVEVLRPPRTARRLGRLPRPRAAEALGRHKHYTSICNAGPSELLAAVALGAREQIHSRNRAILRENPPLFDDFSSRHGDLFSWTRPDGAEAFCQELVKTQGVLLLPASVYTSDLAPVPADRFRVGLGRRNSAPALAAFERFLTTRRAERR